MRTILIRNATLYDGGGGPPEPADVAIEGSRIAEVGSIDGGAATEVDASGLAVAPGFIDVHTHDDFAVLLHPEMAFKSLGGVTTCIVGNCGMGAAPWAEAARMARVFHPGRDVPRYEGHAGYLAHLDGRPPGVNVGMLAGHGTLRLAAMERPGGNEPTTSEMGAMKALLHEALDAGAFGLSTGLIYEPGRNARTEEIVELATEMRGTGALYTTHMRDEAAGLLDAVGEAIRVGEEARVPVQISHHKATGRAQWGLVERSLASIDAARARGVRVAADQYPYTAGSTILGAVVQNRMVGEGADAVVTPDDVVLASSPGHPEWEGKSLATLRAELGDSVEDVIGRVLREAPLTTVILHTMSEDDVRTVLRHPTTMIGSDGIPTLDGKPHPRLYGSFARVLGRYAREEGVLSMAEAVRRMTGLAADTFGLEGRGYVRAGHAADLVVFDETAILDRGTFEHPARLPDGIRHVFVNGVEVARGQKHTGARPGRALRRSSR